MYKVSIIIPVYNAEKFIDNTVKCILNQSIGFENIEVIFVDDCSSDNSRDIINEYAMNYENIKYEFLNKNSGSASKPRNIGIQKASAPFIIFLDSDDEFYNDYCEILYNTINNADVDVVNCERTSKLNNKLYIPNNIQTFDDYQKSIGNDEKIFLRHTVWGKIFRKSFLKENNIQFLNMLFEDIVFSLECTVKTNKNIINLPNYPGYIYLIENDDSITHDVSLKTLEDFLKCIELLYDLIKNDYSKENCQRLLNIHINMVFFILAKLENKFKGIKLLYEFENNFEVNLNPPFKPWALINNKIINMKFKQSLIMVKFMGMIYNNRKLRNLLFVRYSGVKLLE